MRVQVLNTLAGVLGFATIVSTAPAISYGPGDVCIDPSIVYVTVTAQPSTVYLTINPHLPSSSTITSTATSHNTIYLPVSGKTETRTQVVAAVSSGAGASVVHHITTVTQQAYVTVTEAPTGNSATASSDDDEGSFSFIVVNGTTSWLGATPNLTGSIVLATSAITLVPVISSKDPAVTSKTTIHSTQQVTSTRTISITTLPLPTHVPGTTGLSYTGTKSGGWNGTSTADGIAPSIGSTGFGTVSKSTLDIFTIDPTISLSSYTAQSGFTAHTTSTALGGLSSKSTSCTSKSSAYSAAPSLYTNGTLSSLPGTATGSAGGLVVSSSPIHSSTYSLINPTSINSSSGSSNGGSLGGTAPYTAPSYSAPIPTGFNSTDPTLSGPSATPSSGLLPLGSVCTSSSQCANGADCYAVNFMLLKACGNFQASCTSDSQCAFNFCVSGFCTGPKSLLSTTQSITSSKSANSTTPPLPVYVIPTQAPLSSSHSSSAISSPTSVSVPTSFSTATSASSKPTTSTSKTSTSSSSAATPTKCGLQGDFTLNFDDLPPLVADNPDTVNPMPLFNPYHQFTFSDGFTVVPPPTVPYVPSSRPLLIEFIPHFNTEGNNTQAGPDTPSFENIGQISDGDGALTGCFTFNFYGASFGCDSLGPDCDFTFTGHHLNITSKVDTLIATQNYAIPACPSQHNCPLTPIILDNAFQELTHIRINVTVANEPKRWWMDDLNFGWFNNTCAAGLCRLNTHIHMKL